MYKLKIFQIVFISLFLLFLIFLFLPKNYTKNYKISNIKITEKYDKHQKIYYYTFEYQKKTLNYALKNKYKQNRKLIDKIKIIKDEANFCLIPSGDLKFYPLCYENNELIHYSLVKSSLKNQIPSSYFKETKKETTFRDIDVYNLDYTYLLWNYDGFYYINKETLEKIDIFSKEQYNISLIGETKDYLVIADYDSNYTYNKIYTIAFKNGKLKEYDLEYPIYFDSFYPGFEKNKLYIVDNKEAMMYEFNAKKGNLTKIKSKTLEAGKWKNVSIKSLINKKLKFTYQSSFEYLLENDTLYLKYANQDLKTKVATNITYIVKTTDDDIYYLKNDTLYHFNPSIGEEKLLSYFEWNFNYKNMIFLN